MGTLKLHPPSLRAVLLLAGCCACGTPHLIAEDGANGNEDTDTVSRAGITLTASRNYWFEDELSTVSTPVGLTILNDSPDTVPVGLAQLSLIDETGHVYPAQPPERVIRELWGVDVSMPPPGSEPPMRAPPPPGTPEHDEYQPEPPAAPSAPQPPAAPPAVSAPAPSQTSAPSGFPGVLLVAHVGGGGAGGHSIGGGGHFGGGHYGGGHFGWGGHRGWGRYGGYGRGLIGYGYGWGWPWYAGLYGWWFGPAYVVGPDNPYAPYYDSKNLQYFEPEQVMAVALRDDELAPHERMGGLVYFAPAWNARLLTLRFAARPAGGTPVDLTTRFEVTR